MDDGKTDGLRTPDRADKPLGRGLEDVSHLFLSPKAPEAASTARPSPPSGSRGGIALLRPASVTREQLAGLVMEFPSALEEGLRAVDANIPCHPCGEIDLLAVSRGSQLTIVDLETTANDALLLRGIGHFHWVARNMHRDLTDAQSALVNARLILLLANHIGDFDVLREAMRMAREDAHPTADT